MYLLHNWLGPIISKDPKNTQTISSGQDGGIGKQGLPPHIKITTKLENNHHSEPPEINLNGSHTTTELKKKTHQDW